MNSKYVYAFAGLLLGLTACSNEDLTSQSGKYNGETVFVSLNVDRSKAATRTTINEVDAEGGIGLSNVWAKGDQVTLVNAAGAVVGILTLEGDGGSSEGIFTGEATIADGEYTVWYLGDAQNGDPYASFNESGEYINKLATAGCEVSGNFSDLNKGDLMNSKVQIIVKNGKASVAENVNLEAQMAMAHFTLSMDGLDAALADDNSSLSISYTIDDTPYSYTITNKNADVYVPLFPGEYAPVFTLNSDGKSYSYSFTNKTKVEAGLYYAVGSGVGNGVSVALTEDKDDLYKEYANEDPRNPLHKFAKYNLTRGEDNLNVFVENEDAYGALYQWGRYYGFIDRNDNTVFGKFNLSSKTYTQFADALGLKRVNNNNDIWDYCVYDPDGSNMYSNPEFNDGFSMKSKVAVVTGMNYFYISGWFSFEVSFDYPHFYDSISNIVTDHPCYYMNGIYDKSLSLQKHGIYYPAYIEEFSNSGDYWVENFGDGGFNWSARAKAQGFTTDKENPCPDGWRLPTESEMKEIIPENGLYQQNGNLSDMLNKYSELRETEKGVKYAIRWNYVNPQNYIEIEAVVVDDTYTSVDQITESFWDKHVSDKVVRKFPFTGGIRPYTGFVFGDTTWDTVICRPISMGKPAFQSYTEGMNEAIGLISPNETGGINNHFGGYWVSEKDLAMKFCAENFEREVNGYVREAESEYTRIRMEQTGPAFGMAIRPVMDKK